jgi:hypothetical protein
VDKSVENSVESAPGALRSFGFGKFPNLRCADEDWVRPASFNLD